MDLNAFLKAYDRAVEELPYVLGEWEQIPEPVRDHYCEELVLLLVRRKEARRVAEVMGLLAVVQERIGAADSVLIELRAQVEAKTGIDPLRALLPSDLSVDEPERMDEYPPFGPQLPMAA